ncbi:hypothetical protein CDD82_5690 [Ophiocordyceps australis]|uniref:Uncharacterized protein n=1 Tax=Ophiocordyceps australis TaxID=1399860 RepID=A0A2C5Z063_9HYPO|nr:hypothetical protein CDD82_5690 [Ophiocordyceps australis]
MIKSKKHKPNTLSKPRRSGPIVISSPLAPAEPRPAKKLPPWDRTVDLVYHMPPPADTQTHYQHDKRLGCFLAAHGRAPAASPWTRLPPAIRQRICLLLVDSHLAALPASPPVTLSRRVFTRATWSRHDLVVLDAVTRPLQPYLATSLALYADVMLALLSRYTFHVVLSPFVGPRLSPLATLWLNKYGPYMDSLIVEIDMTCLGLGPEPAAASLGPGLARIQALLHDLVASQLRRPTSLPLAHLALLCRRFHGSRPPRPSSSSSSADAEAVPRSSYASSRSHRSHHSQQSLKTALSSNTRASSTHSLEAPCTPSFHHHHPRAGPEYCPDAHLAICDALSPLASRIASIRLCGFSESYSRRLVRALFPAANPDACRRFTPATAWPLLPGQTCCVDSPPPSSRS